MFDGDEYGVEEHEYDDEPVERLTLDNTPDFDSEPYDKLVYLPCISCILLTGYKTILTASNTSSC